jgi:MraZ protein
MWGKDNSERQMLLSGKYEHNIDLKNRLAIPSQMREEMERCGDGKKVFVARGMEKGTLAIWPEVSFLAMADQLPKSPIPDPDQLAFEEMFFASAHGIVPDSQGRVVMPELLMQEMGIGRQVMITGVRDHMAVWNRDHFTRFQEENLAKIALLQQRTRDLILRDQERNRTQT